MALDKAQDMNKTWACSTVERKQGYKQDWVGVQLAQGVLVQVVGQEQEQEQEQPGPGETYSRLEHTMAGTSASEGRKQAWEVVVEGDKIPLEEGEGEEAEVVVGTREEEEEVASPDYSCLADNICVGYILVCTSSNIVVDMLRPQGTWVAFQLGRCCAGADNTAGTSEHAGTLDTRDEVRQRVSGPEQGVQPEQALACLGVF